LKKINAERKWKKIERCCGYEGKIDIVSPCLLSFSNFVSLLPNKRRKNFRSNTRTISFLFQTITMKQIDKEDDIDKKFRKAMKVKSDKKR
jgi:hypothetical protein